jgi:PKD domain
LQYRKLQQISLVLLKQFSMKKLFTCLLVLTILISSCQKDDSIDSGRSVALPENAVAKPAASFKINNSLSDDLLIERQILNIDNQSTNAVSYSWDFGNGTYSTDKIPLNISFAPCGSVYTITLTAKNKSGETAVYSQTVTILCSGKHPVGG